MFRRQHRRLEKRKLATHRWLNTFHGDLAASQRGAKEHEMEVLLAKIEEADVTYVLLYAMLVLFDRI